MLILVSNPAVGPSRDVRMGGLSLVILVSAKALFLHILVYLAFLIVSDTQNAHIQRHLLNI